MNFKNRIKTIEKKMNISNSVYCNCYGDEPLKYEVIPITLDEWKNRIHIGQETSERLPDVCDRCRKPVDKRFIEKTFDQYIETV